MTKISIPPLSEYYNFDRLEDAARELHLNTEEQENEEKLFNLHNHLIWYSYRPFQDALTDAIFSITIQNIIKDYNLTPQDIPADYRDLLEREKGSIGQWIYFR